MRSRHLAPLRKQCITIELLWNKWRKQKQKFLRIIKLWERTEGRRWLLSTTGRFKGHVNNVKLFQLTCWCNDNFRVVSSQYYNLHKAVCSNKWQEKIARCEITPFGNFSVKEECMAFSIRIETVVFHLSNSTIFNVRNPLKLNVKGDLLIRWKLQVPHQLLLKIIVRSCITNKEMGPLFATQPIALQPKPS